MGSDQGADEKPLLRCMHCRPTSALPVNMHTVCKGRRPLWALPSTCCRGVFTVDNDGATNFLMSPSFACRSLRISQGGEQLVAGHSGSKRLRLKDNPHTHTHTHRNSTSVRGLIYSMKLKPRCQSMPLLLPCLLACRACHAMIIVDQCNLFTNCQSECSAKCVTHGGISPTGYGDHR